MGDEVQRSCPDCGERLSFDARQCECGWGKEGKKARAKASRTTPDMGWKHVCTWRSGSLFCTYPVGLFIDQNTRGFCMFHRAQEGGIEAATIARDSAGHTSDQYLERARLHAYGEPGVDNPNVARLRAQLKRHAGGDRVGLFATRVLGDMGGSQDEPGAAG